MNRTGSGSVVIAEHSVPSHPYRSGFRHVGQHEAPPLAQLIQRYSRRRYDMINEANAEDELMAEAEHDGLSGSAHLRSFADGVDSVFGRRGSA